MPPIEEPIEAVPANRAHDHLMQGGPVDVEAHLVGMHAADPGSIGAWPRSKATTIHDHLHAEEGNLNHLFEVHPTVLDPEEPYDAQEVLAHHAQAHATGYLHTRAERTDLPRVAGEPAGLVVIPIIQPHAGRVGFLHLDQRMVDLLIEHSTSKVTLGRIVRQGTGSHRVLDSVSLDPEIELLTPEPEDPTPAQPTAHSPDKKAHTHEGHWPTAEEAKFHLVYAHGYSGPQVGHLTLADAELDHHAEHTRIDRPLIDRLRKADTHPVNVIAHMATGAEDFGETTTRRRILSDYQAAILDHLKDVETTHHGVWVLLDEEGIDVVASDLREIEEMRNDDQYLGAHQLAANVDRLLGITP